ncbi:hypothetical protein HA402_001534 [Bradysia odoriphaga]|nr:hypothetical protein HA402_001534 [Bradysia odoriphaga]
MKIGDFGMSRCVDRPGDTYAGYKGEALPIRWLSPEALNEQFSSASDVWAFGVTVYEMLTNGGVPYHDKNNESTIIFVSSGGILTRPPNCPEQTFIELTKCWRKQPENRCTFNELITWLKQLYSTPQ